MSKINHINRTTKNLPLILIEIYLIFTLFLYSFGPIKWKTHNVNLFWFLIISYHITFCLGYLIVSMKHKNIEIHRNDSSKGFIIRNFWIVLGLAFIVNCINYRNLTRSNSYIPYELPLNFIQGLLHPAARYYWKLSSEAAGQFSGNNLVTMASGIIYAACYCLPSLMVFLWPRLKRSHKIASIIIVMMEIATTVSVGTNKLLFELLFVFMASFVLECIVNYRNYGMEILTSRKPVIYITIFLLFFAPFYFTYSVRDRTNNNIGYIAAGNEDIDTRIDVESEKESFLDSMFIGLDSYICQGYYGMSLALDQDFTSTYGIGHSNFLINTVNQIFGIDFSEDTYQYKINDKWNRLSRWHSFYSQMANDVHFYGVIFIMLILGGTLSFVWLDAVRYDDMIAKCLLMLFVIMFLYMPANNQVGNMMGLFCTFWELLVIWFIQHIARFRKYQGRRLKGAEWNS